MVGIDKPGLRRGRTFIIVALTTVFGAALAGWLLFDTATLSNSAAEARSAIGSGHEHASAIPWCSGVPDTSPSDFYSEMMGVNAGMHESMQVVPSGDPHRDFMRMMIPHHQGAIDMARVLLKYGRDEKLKRLAQSIIVEQGQEIAYMRILLAMPSGETFSTNPKVGQ
jgi:uncharacterized protein (DUF305 family)